MNAKSRKQEIIKQELKELFNKLKKIKDSTY